MGPLQYYKHKIKLTSYNMIWNKLSKCVQCQHIGPINDNPVSSGELAKENKTWG